MRSAISGSRSTTSTVPPAFGRGPRAAGVRTISGGATGSVNQNVEPSPERALTPISPAEQLDDALADRQPESGAADLARHRGVDPVELREQLLLVLLG